MCENYLLSYFKDQIIDILKDPHETKHFSVDIDFVELSGNDPNLGNNFLPEPEKSLSEWDKSLCNVQTKLILQSEENYIFKKYVHCRIYSLPLYPELHRTKLPQYDDINKFLQVSGTVFRMTTVKMLESQRQYICTKCKHIMTVDAIYHLKNIIKPPKKCGNAKECQGTTIVSVGEFNAEFCKDYQEVKLQETVSKLDVGSVPKSMWVTLEDNLVDSCKPGDNITVCGLVKTRHDEFIVGKKMEMDLVLKANHVQVNNNNTSTLTITPEHKDMFQSFWKTYSDTPLAARDMILKSICPEVFGLFMVKLAVAVVLAGGSNLHNNSDTGVRVRSEPHLLLVGDPGTAKSQLLRFASKIIPRSVLTTGVGSTAAGLTVTAVMENGEWQLEGGALVMSDGGICCIDEFNTMKEHDRTSIHEAMEQQTISVAKAGIVCKLSTRCSILAATNPKGNLDPSQPLSMNVALPSPLLSRFDLVLLLKDTVDAEWDSHLADYILNSFDVSNSSKLCLNINWTIETLQAYFAIIKKIHPVLTENSNRILSGYYQAQRRKNSRNKARTTVRLLDSLVRLSQGHARLMFHEEVEIVDAVVAVILVEIAMEVESSVFNISFNVRADFPHNPMEYYKELAEIVLKKLELEDLLEKELAPKPQSSEKLNRSKSPPRCTLQNEPKLEKMEESLEKPGPSETESGSNSKVPQDEMRRKKNPASDPESPNREIQSTSKLVNPLPNPDSPKREIQSKCKPNDDTMREELATREAKPNGQLVKDFFSKFKFVPKENQTVNVKPVEPETTSNIFENEEIGDISFTNVPSSTQKLANINLQEEKKKDDVKVPKKIFNFKKVTSPEKLARKENLPVNMQSSIFENQEDLENLNLDI